VSEAVCRVPKPTRVRTVASIRSAEMSARTTSTFGFRFEPTRTCWPKAGRAATDPKPAIEIQTKAVGHLIKCRSGPLCSPPRWAAFRRITPQNDSSVNRIPRMIRPTSPKLPDRWAFGYKEVMNRSKVNSKLFMYN